MPSDEPARAPGRGRRRIVVLALVSVLAIAAVGGVVSVMAVGNDEADCRKSPPVASDSSGYDRFGAVAVIGLDPETGAKRWVQTLGDLRDASGPAGSAAVRDGVGVFFSNPDGPTFRIDLASGDILRCREGQTSRTPAEDLPGEDGEPVVTASYSTGDFAAATDGVRFVIDQHIVPPVNPYPERIEDLQQNPPSDAERERLLDEFRENLGEPLTGFADGPDTLTAIETSDRVRWQISLGHLETENGEPIGRSFDRVFALGDQVIVSSLGTVVAIDADTGEVLWVTDHGSPGTSEPYTEGGSYSYFVEDQETGTIVGAIVAMSPVPEGH